MRLILLIALLSPILLAQTSGDQLTWLQSAGAALDLVHVDEKNLGNQPTTAISGLEILPLEITNRTIQSSFDPSHSRLVTRHGLRNAELPNGGKLFRYRRSAGQFYGYFLILPSGHVIVLVERSAPGNQDPFVDRIGLAPDGLHATFATTAGSLLLARLDGKKFASTQSASRVLSLPQGITVEHLSMTPGRSRMFVVTDDDRVRRCNYADGAQLVDVTPPSTGNVRLKDEFALSGDGRTVAFLFGPKDYYSIYLLGETGPARKLSPPPAKYEEPGYLPEKPGGPELLLNHDASRLMYTDATVRDEIYLLDTAGSLVTHVSSDQNIAPYIGVGILPTFAADLLTMAIGDINRFDWFQATTNSAFVQNLTLTGPNPTRPFGAGNLVPIASFQSGNGHQITTERTGTGARRVRVIQGSNSTILVPELRDELSLGSGLSQGISVLLPGRYGDVSLRISDLSPRLATPPTVALSTDVTSPGGQFSAATVQFAGLHYPFLHIHGKEILVLAPSGVPVQIVITRSVGLLLNDGQLHYLAPGISQRLSSPLVFAVLSGMSN